MTTSEIPQAPAGELLRQHRRHAGLTQQELTAKTGLSLRALRDIERGRVRQPHGRSLSVLFTALRLSTAQRDEVRAALAADLNDAGPRVGVLGPLQIIRSGLPVTPGPPLRRRLLGLLALHAGMVVNRDEVIDVLWDDHPPRSCQSLVAFHIGKLRDLLEPDRHRGTQGTIITQTRVGYRFDPEQCPVDLVEFDVLAAQARRAAGSGDPAEAFVRWEQALQRWRGPALAEDPVLRGHVTAVAANRRRVEAGMALADLGRQLGRPDAAVACLRQLCAIEPLHEGLHARLIVALAGQGERAAALRLFADFRDRLQRELGTEPGPDVHAAHLRVRRGEVSTDPTSPTDAGSPRPAETATRPPVRPAQLPAPPMLFTGRGGELRRLDALGRSGGGRPTTIVISGTGGVGKTALAVHWGHRVAHLFPDGQLYVDLRGYSPGEPMRPIEALGRLLRGLGVSGVRIPVETDEAASLLRSVLADKQALLVLDNAGSPEQVRWLLPGTPTCRVVITSRERLAGLIATHGAKQLRLDTLTGPEAVALLSRLIGDDRAAREPGSVRDLATLCGHLPLAIRIAGANLATRGERSIDEYVAELAHIDVLNALVVDDDPGHGVRIAFDMSYRTLPTAAARVFRLLALIPGPDFTADAVAALVEATTDEAARQLGVLVTASLVSQDSGGRFSRHDLLRRYAAHRMTLDAPADADAATDRLLGWYVGHAYQAAILVAPHQPRLAEAEAAMHAQPHRFDDYAEALAWLDAELPNLLAAVEHAAKSGRPAAWLLTDALRGYLWGRQHHTDLVLAAASALPAAETRGDARAQAAVRQALGLAYYSHGDHQRATEEHQRALELSRASGWCQAEAAALANLGLMAWEAGRLRRAAQLFNEGLVIEQRERMYNREARTLVSLGHIAARAGRLADAHASYTRSLNVTHHRVAPEDQLLALNCLGYVLHALGRLDEASHQLLAGLDLAAELSNAYSACTILECLAAVYRDAGRRDEAMDCAHASLALADNLREVRLRAEPLNTIATILGDTAADQAGELHAEALALAEAAEDRYTEALVLADLASLIAASDPATAHEHATRAHAVAERGEFRVLEGNALTALARAELFLNALSEANDHARAAAAIQRSTGHRLGEARALSALADVLELQPNVDDAAASRLRVQHLRAELGMPQPIGDRVRTWHAKIP